MFIPDMLTRFLFTIFLIPNSLLLFAQKKNLEYGFHGGLNINNVIASGVDVDARKGSTLTGLNFGGNIKVDLSSIWKLKFMLAYERNGWSDRSIYITDTLGNDLGKGEAFYKLDYLTLPVMAEISFGKKVKINFDAGFFAGILVGNILELKTLDLSNQRVSKGHVKNFNSVNFGISTGAQVQIPATEKIYFNIDLRNSMGLSNIYNPNPNGFDRKTQAFSFLIGLSYHLQALKLHSNKS